MNSVSHQVQCVLACNSLPLREIECGSFSESIMRYQPNHSEHQYIGVLTKINISQLPGIARCVGARPRTDGM